MNLGNSKVLKITTTKRMKKLFERLKSYYLVLRFTYKAKAIPEDYSDSGTNPSHFIEP